VDLQLRRLSRCKLTAKKIGWQSRARYTGVEVENQLPTKKRVTGNRTAILGGGCIKKINQPRKHHTGKGRELDETEGAFSSEVMWVDVRIWEAAVLIA
jgi:hypothetical protein